MSTRERLTINALLDVEAQLWLSASFIDADEVRAKRFGVDKNERQLNADLLDGAVLEAGNEIVATLQRFRVALNKIRDSSEDDDD